MLKKIFRWPFHPLLFAVGYVFIQFNLHADLYAASEVWMPLLVLVGMAGVVFLLCRFWQSDLHVAGVWASAWVFILTFVCHWAIWSPSVLHMVLLGIMTSGIMVLAQRMSRFHAPATRSLNIFAVIFLFPQVSVLVSDRYFLPRLPATETASVFLTTTQQSARISTPNIFHIVMDAYSRDDVLQTVYGFDNTPFIETLKEVGFQVFADAHAPFNQTLLSMASVFSGAYLDQERLQHRYRDAPQLRQSLGRFLNDGAVSTWLRGLGYSLSVSTTGYHFLQTFHVDRWERPPSGETNLFALALYDASLVGWLDQLIFAGAGQQLIFRYTGSAVYLNDLVRYVLPLGVPDDLRAPYLVYRHILAPHPPFTLDPSGHDIKSEQFSTVSEGEFAHRNSPELREAYIRGYVEKLRFVNRELLIGLKRILKEAPRPFVIFLHGDHGGGAYLTQESAMHTCFKERFSVLMAVYASDPELQNNLVNSLNQAPNPVNFYRALYNAVHKTNLPMLPDQSQFATWSEPWIFTPVPPEALNTECTRK